MDLEDKKCSLEFISQANGSLLFLGNDERRSLGRTIRKFIVRNRLFW